MKNEKHSGMSCITLRIEGEISDVTERRWRDELRCLSIDDGDRRCLFVTLNSHGGGLLAAARIAGALSAWRGPRFVTVRGACESAGLLLLASFPRRSADLGSVFEFHQPIIDGPLASGDKTMLVQARRALARRLAAGFGKPVPEMERHLALGTRLTANEAKAMGLIGEVHIGSRRLSAQRTRWEGGEEKLSLARM